MAWTSRTPPATDADEKRSVEAGIFRKCPQCGETRPAEDFSRIHEVCPGCGAHERLGAAGWIDVLFDAGTFVEQDAKLAAADPLEFRDQKRYRDRTRAATRSTGHREAIVTGVGAVEGRPVAGGVFVFSFLGGSMGSVVGEKVTRVFETALARKIPALVLSASGGARMHEGIFSLMQMAKTAAARARLRDERVPFVSVLANPTTGGVAASFALLGDVIVAEPGALIGFAGPRVIEQTIRQKLPKGFQRSEFLLDHGVIDMIVPRAQMRARIAQVLRLLAPERPA